MNDHGEGSPPPGEGDFNYESLLPQPIVVRLEDLITFDSDYTQYRRSLNDRSVGTLPGNRTPLSFSEFIRAKLAKEKNEEIDPESPIHIEAGFNRNPEEQIKGPLEGICLSDEQAKIIKRLYGGQISFGSERPRTQIPIQIGDTKGSVRINTFNIEPPNDNSVAVTQGLAERIGQNRLTIIGRPFTMTGDLQAEDIF